MDCKGLVSAKLKSKMAELSQVRSGGGAPRCLAPWQSLMIDVNGNVQPCAYRGNYTNISNRPSLGNINERTLKEIWNGEEARFIRACMAKGDLDSAGCGKCLAVSQGQPLSLEYDERVLTEETSTPYSKNLLQKIDEILRGSSVCESHPTVLYYTPDHRCNLACAHCYQNISRKASIHRKSAGDELLGLVPYLSDVVAGGGEPLILPFWRRFLASEAKKENPYLRFATTTNATLVREDVFFNISAFDRIAIIISLDGASKEVFERIRVPAVWEVFLANVRRFRELCADKCQFFSFNISTMKDNLLQLPEFVEFCASLEAGYNYQPVVAYPAEQSLRCFNDVPRQMSGWREALDRARALLFSRFFPAMEEAAKEGRVYWDESYREIYNGHITALDGLIPWHLLDFDYVRCSGSLPDNFIERIRWCYDIKTSRVDGQYPVLLFFRDEDSDTAEPHFYSFLDRNLNFEVSLPPGAYRCLAVPSDGVLGTRSSAWSDIKMVVDQSGLRLYGSKRTDDFVFFPGSVPGLLARAKQVLVRVFRRQV